jgi:hypothetical protein
MSKKVRYYQSDKVLEEFYLALAKGNEKILRRVHIPHSSVFYAREAYYNHSGEWITLDRMERSMYLEGMLSAYNVLDPERTRDWED